MPKSFGPGGLWNGVSYQKEVLAGEYEHLAIVSNPRYEESIILTPDEFKAYNDEKTLELERLANDNPKGEKGMKLQLWKRAKVENSADLADMSVLLPKSNREVTIITLVNEADDAEMKKKEPQMANGEHMVDCYGSKMSVNELVEAHKKLKDEMESLKAKKVDEMGDEGGEPGDDGDEMPNAEEPGEDEAAKKKALELAEHEEKEIVEAKEKDKTQNARPVGDKRTAEKKAADKEKADRLRVANTRDRQDEPTLMLSEDRIARGKARYGSSR